MHADAGPIFISYSHENKPLALDRLVACLTAGGAETVFDDKCFSGGLPVPGQMDQHQDRCPRQLLLISPAYLRSKPCRREMERALARDPKFEQGLVLPLLLDGLGKDDLPDAIKGPDPLFFNLSAGLPEGERKSQWSKALAWAGASLGADPLRWLAARDRVRDYVRGGNSVCLLVDGEGKAWEPLLRNISSPYDPKGELPALPRPLDWREDFSLPEARGRILHGGQPGHPVADGDEFNQACRSIEEGCRWVTFSHFHKVAHKAERGLDVHFWDNMGVLQKEKCLRFVVQTRTRLHQVLQTNDPRFDPMSSWASPIGTVEL